MFEIPNSWIEQADRWASKFSAATCIAGGALRDTDHGVAFKDVDIFVQVETPPEYDDMDAALRDDKGILILDKEYMALQSRPSRITSEVSVVWDYKVKGVEFNVIFLTEKYNTDSFYKRLDFGMSRISWWADKRVVEAHDTYFTDKEAKEFRIRRCENRRQLDRSILRGQRLIRDRYPAHNLILPRVEDLPLAEG